MRQGAANSIPKKDCNQDVFMLNIPGESETKAVYFFAISTYKDEAIIVQAANNRMRTGLVLLVGSKAQARAEWKKLTEQGYVCFSEKFANAAKRATGHESRCDS